MSMEPFYLSLAESGRKSLEIYNDFRSIHFDEEAMQFKGTVLLHDGLESIEFPVEELVSFVGSILLRRSMEELDNTNPMDFIRKAIR